MNQSDYVSVKVLRSLLIISQCTHSYANPRMSQEMLNVCYFILLRAVDLTYERRWVKRTDTHSHLLTVRQAPAGDWVNHFCKTKT